MQEVQILHDVEVLSRPFTIYGSYEEPLFKAQDVAQFLGLSNSRDMIKRVDADELSKLNLRGQQGETWFLTENGFYEVVMQSRKPIAKMFKRAKRQFSGRYAKRVLTILTRRMQDGQKTRRMSISSFLRHRRNC